MMKAKVYCVLQILMLFGIGWAETQNGGTPTGERSTANGIMGSSGINDLNVISGVVSFQIPLHRLENGKAAYQLALNYSSNVRTNLVLKNENGQAGWVGLGWQLGTSAFLADLQGSEGIDDDEYTFLNEKGGKDKVFLHNGEYKKQKYDYEKIHRNVVDGKVLSWTLTTKSGMKYRYGENDDARCYRISDHEERIGVNDMSHSLEQIAFRWNLSSIEDLHGNRILFEYEKETVELDYGGIGYPYTLAFYVSRILEEKSGLEVVFDLADRDGSEYAEKYTEEDEEYIYESYETKYLMGIRVNDGNGALIRRFLFDYALQDLDGPGGTAYESKRYLMVIKDYGRDDILFYPSNFTYNWDVNEPNPGAVVERTDRTGKTHIYEYGELFEVIRTDREENYVYSDEYVQEKTAESIIENIHSHTIVGQEDLTSGLQIHMANQVGGGWHPPVSLSTETYDQVIPRFNDNYIVAWRLDEFAGTNDDEWEYYDELKVTIVKQNTDDWVNSDVFEFTIEALGTGGANDDNGAWNHAFHRDYLQFVAKENYVLLVAREMLNVFQDDEFFGAECRCQCEDCNFETSANECFKVNQRRYYDRVILFYKDATGTWHKQENDALFCGDNKRYYAEYPGEETSQAFNAGRAIWQTFDPFPTIRVDGNQVSVTRTYNPENKYIGFTEEDEMFYTYTYVISPTYLEDHVMIEERPVTGYLQNYYENWYRAGAGYSLYDDGNLYNYYDGADQFPDDNHYTDLITQVYSGTFNGSSLNLTLEDEEYYASNPNTVWFQDDIEERGGIFEITASYEAHAAWTYGGARYTLQSIKKDNVTYFSRPFSSYDGNYEFLVKLYPGEFYSYALFGDGMVMCYNHAEQTYCELNIGKGTGERHYVSGLVNLGSVFLEVRTSTLYDKETVGCIYGVIRDSSAGVEYIKQFGEPLGCGYGDPYLYSKYYVTGYDGHALIFEDGEMQLDMGNFDPMDGYVENIRWYPLISKKEMDKSRIVSTTYEYCNGNYEYLVHDPKYNTVYAPQVVVNSSALGEIEYRYDMHSTHSLLIPGLIAGKTVRDVHGSVVAKYENAWDVKYVFEDEDHSEPYFDESIVHSRKTGARMTKDNVPSHTLYEINEGNGMIAVIKDSNNVFVKRTEIDYAFEHDDDAVALVTANALGLPYEKRIYEDNGSVAELLSRSRTTYTTDAVHGFIVPDEELVYNGSGFNMMKKRTMHNGSGGVMEFQDVKGMYTSIKHSHDDMLVSAEIRNARYAECSFVSFEDGVAADWYCSVAPQYVTDEAHTGEVSAMVTQGAFNRAYTVAGGLDVQKDYRFSVWVKRHRNTTADPVVTCEINGAAHALVPVTEDGWQLVTTDISADALTGLGAGALVLAAGAPGTGGVCYIDDIRFRPKDSRMTTYTYEPQRRQVTSVTDDLDRVTRYAYDVFGRRTGVTDQDNAQVSTSFHNLLNETF